MIKRFSVYTFLYLKRSYSSALYITGDKANETFRVLTPHIDFEDRMEHKFELERNIKLRELQINVEKLEKYWNFYKSIDSTKEQLEFNKTYIGNIIAQLMKDSEKNSQEISKLKVHMKLIKDDIKNVKDYLYGIEEHAVEQVLALPNILHPKTPQNENIVIYNYLRKPDFVSDSHVNIAKANHLVEVASPTVCFLKNNAALFENVVLNYVDNLLLSKNFLPFSNTDFVRSVVVEGCGTDFRNSSKVLTLEDKHDDKNHELSRLHLVGGASLYSFMAYFTKHLLQPTHLPLYCHALGRKYQPVNSDSFSLLNLEQETCAQVFIATLQDDDFMNKELENCISIVKQLYEGLGYHFQLVYVPAKMLHVSETIRLSVQMFSTFLQEYVEVANISVNDDYLSKRLLFTYNDSAEKKFPKVLSGTLLNVQKLLACILEQNEVKENLLHDVLLLLKKRL